MINRLAVLCSVSLFCLTSAANAIPEHAPRPGGTAVVAIAGANSDSRPIVMFDDKRVLVLRREHEWVAVIGIPLNQPIGTAKAIVRIVDQDSSTITFEVKHHAYREQRLTVSRLTLT
jgi:hypothetical protein